MNKNNVTLDTLTGEIDEEREIIVNETTNDDGVSLRAIEELLNLDKIKTISRIKLDQVSIITKLFVFSSTFKVSFTDELATNILQLLISVNGLGRQELVQLVQQRVNIINPNEKPKGIFR